MVGTSEADTVEGVVRGSEARKNSVQSCLLRKVEVKNP